MENGVCDSCACEEEDPRTFVGEFELRHGRLYVSDPCYGRESTNEDNSLGYIVHNAANGIWIGSIELNDEGRVVQLTAECEDLDPDICGTYFIDGVCVDSGQMGIYDYEKFLDVEHSDCMEIIEDRKDAGIVSGAGIVCMSGYGDGSYRVGVTRDVDGLARFVSVTFIYGEDEEEVS